MSDSLYGEGLLGESLAPKRGDKLSERFMLPPFSVLSAREGWWQERKRAWLSIGIQSELGRGETLIGGSSLYSGDDPKYGNRGPKVAKVSPGGFPRPAADYSEKKKGDGSGRPMSGTGVKAGALTFGVSVGAFDNRDQAAKLREAERAAEGALTFSGQAASFDYYRVKEGTKEETATTGTSIFDPVLCETVYRWFCPPAGQVLDPFAGGSVRGIVASRLGLRYTGLDLSAAQVGANEVQGAALCHDNPPVWHCADSTTISTVCANVQADMVFSCPPYGSLEVYSDDPRDISTYTVDEFRAAYTKIIAETCKLLNPNRFACFVVGDYRDKKGFYCNFPGVTIAAFEAAGLRLYNWAILVTAAGSLPIRVSAQFPKGRKLGKTHQDILVFVKGDPQTAAAACGDKID